MKPRQRPAEPALSEPAADEAQGEHKEEAPAAGKAPADEPATGAEPSPELAHVIRLTDALAPQFQREGGQYRVAAKRNVQRFPRPV